jgi:hypothetical protein
VVYSITDPIYDAQEYYYQERMKAAENMEQKEREFIGTSEEEE